MAKESIPKSTAKKLDYVTHTFEDNDGGGWLYINLSISRTGTNFSMDFSMNNPRHRFPLHRVWRYEHGRLQKISAHITTGEKK